MKKTALFLAFLASFFTLSAQSWEDEILDSKDIISEAYQLHKSKDYEGAIKLYDLVLEGDTNYNIAFLEKLSSLLMADRDEEVKELCIKGLEEDPTELIYYVNLGSAYDKLGDLEKSIATFDAGIKMFPMSYSLEYNKGITYENAKKYDLAVQAYQNTLRKNPFHNGAHIRLAMLSRGEGKLTQAALSMMTYLLLNLETVGRKEILGELNTYLSEKPVYEPKGIKFSSKGDDFEEIDELIKTQVALNKKYVFNSDIDFPIIRQCHALLTLLKDYEGEGGFYDELYVPFYQEIMKTDNFEGLSYFMASSSPNESVKQSISKNEKVIKSFATWYYGDGLRLYRDGEGKVARIFYGAPYPLNATGSKVNEQYEGDWTFYYEEGCLLSEGKYAEDERIGNWKWYYMNGQNSSSFGYKENLKDGPYKIYFKNGNLKEEGTYNMGELNGEIKLFFINGGLQNIFNYQDGKLDGKQYEYYSNGSLALEIDFKNGEQDGWYKSYYSNGKLEYQYEIELGVKSGIYESFYVDGTKNYTCTYKDGLQDGAFERHFENGILDYKGTAKAGTTVGIYEENYNNGDKFKVITYDELGKLNGSKKEYDVDGILYLETTYTKGEITNIVYYNKDGSVLADQKLKNGQNFKIYYPTGELKGEGKLMKGQKDGPWTFYFKDGSVESKGAYKLGLEDGNFVWNHENGELSSKSFYKDGVEDAYLKVYDSNAGLIREGRIYDGQKIGPWKYYDAFKNLTEETFYVEGKANGPSKSYDIEGNLESIDLYELGKVVGIEKYDTAGNLYFKVNYKDLKENELVNIPGRFYKNDLTTISYKNGEMNGPFQYKVNNVFVLDGNFTVGERSGIWKWSYIDGSPSYQTNYVMGALEGMTTDWHRFGFKLTETNYFNDDMNGVRTRFFPDGKVFYEEEYMEDYLSGMTHYFDLEGQKILGIYYLQNCPIYYITSYFKSTPDTTYIVGGTADIDAKHENGKSAVQMSFKNTWQYGDFKIYDKQGNLYYHSKLKDDALDGERIYYYPGSTQKMIVENYTKGNQDGTAYKYAKDGKVLMSIDYKLGNIHGDFVKYDANGKQIFKIKYFDDDVLSVE